MDNAEEIMKSKEAFRAKFASRNSDGKLLLKKRILSDLPNINSRMSVRSDLNGADVKN